MLNPLFTMCALTLVFSQIFGFQARGYALYVLSGFLLWNFFAQSTSAAMGDLIWSGGLLHRIHIPKAIFAFAAIGTGIVNLLLSLIPYCLIVLILGAELKASIFLLPIPIIFTSLFAIGIALILSSVVIYFTDVIPMYEVLLTIWMYLTPVIYPLELLTEQMQALFRFNPFYSFISFFRAVLYEGQFPDVSIVVWSAVISITTIVFGWWMFTRKSREYVYRV
jgi:ABC-type polysaccharide/polyol phosphate export permease